jgi:hypothetical protein
LSDIGLIVPYLPPVIDEIEPIHHQFVVIGYRGVGRNEPHIDDTVVPVVGRNKKGQVGGHIGFQGITVGH